MRALITVEFQKVGNIKVDDKLLEQEPKLIKVTAKAVKNICKALEEHYKSKKIQIKVTSEVVND
jgi:2C-methyl-D-erythritol 2,4-cyclodiphosphate synthase